MSTGEYLGNGNPDGTCIGYSATELVAFHGGTPCDQAAAITALATTVSVSTTPWGFAGSTQANAIATAVNNIVTALTEKGLLAA